MEKSEEVRSVKGISTKILVRSAFLAALSIVLTRMLSVMLDPAHRIGFGTIPLMLSGLIYGPYIGGIVGLVLDLIGVMINPQGAFHFGFTLNAILTGVIPGVVKLLFLNGKRERPIVAIVLSNVLVMIIVYMILNTLWLSQLLGKGMYALLITRIPKSIVECVVFSIIMIALYKALKKTKF